VDDWPPALVPPVSEAPPLPACPDELLPPLAGPFDAPDPQPMSADINTNGNAGVIERQRVEAICMGVIEEA